MNKRLSLMLLFLLAMAVSPLRLLAQATASGAVTGTVSDPSQAVVNGAEISIVNAATDATRTTTTNNSGSYRFDLLQAGNYKLTVKSTGFSTTVQTLELLVGQTVTANVTLRPGSATQTVEVAGENPLIDTTKTSVGTEITPSEVEQLPMIGRDVANLAYLAPGVKFADSYDPTKARYAILSVNGDGGRNVNVTVNGVDNKDNTVGGPVMQLPLEAVEEYHISTQRFSAENGRSEGAAINIITKRGGNGYHGSLFGYFRDAALDTDEKDANGDGTSSPSHPSYSRQQFGGSVGGPFIKDKAFGFFALEREREHQNSPEQTNSYTELAAAAPFFPADKPWAAIPKPFFEYRYNGRADYTFTPREAAYLSYTSQANNSLNDQSDGTGDATNGNFTVNHLQLASLNLNSIINDTTVNTATFGFQYWNNLISSNISAPLVTFNNLSESFGTNTNVPQQSYQRKWQFKDDFSKAIGKHTLKGGVDYIWNPVEGGFFEFSSTLEIDFADDPSKILSDAADYPNGFQTPGAVVGMAQANGNPYFNVATKQLGFYGQDEWKATRHLTLSLGLRWDKDINMIGGSDIKTSRTYLELKALNSPISNPFVSSIAKDDNKDFSPRVGFAYDVTGKGNHVIRGGYGLYYGNVFQNIPLFMEQMSNPTVFQTVLSLSSTTDIVPGTGKTLGEWQYGVDPMPTIPPPSSDLAPGSVGRLMDPRYRNPITEEFNAGYSWAINQNAAVEVEYTHVLGLHENKTINIDQKVPINGVLTRPLDPAFAQSTQPELASVRTEESIGRERYDGVNFVFKDRVAKHFQANANYTLAWANGYDTGGGSFRNYARNGYAPFAKNEWGPSPNDERNHVTVNGVANLPFGFDLAPILQFGTARPWQPSNGTNSLNAGGGTTNAVLVPISDPTNYKAYAGAAVSDTTACYYGIGGPQTCTIAKYDPLRGDPFFQLDMRLAKTITFAEKFHVELVAQAFNLTNRANYGNNFGTSITSPTYGHPVGFIAPGATTIPRSVWGEMGARFTF
jgi:outer membrane receptor protein involved in Fe transport